MRKTKHLKKFLSKGSWVILASFLLLGNSSFTFAQISVLSDEEIINRGLNEYIDPSQAPIYDQVYTTITFKEGVTLDDLEALQEVTPIFKGEGETAPTLYTKLGHKVDEVEQTVSIQSGKDFKEIREKFSTTVQELRSKNIELEEPKATNPRVYFVSLNHDRENENVKSFKALAGEKDLISAEKKEVLLSKLSQAKQIRDSKLDATPARDVLTPEGLKYEVEKVTSTSNKELMDEIYPPQEQIERINEEIKEERRDYLEFENQKEQRPTERIKSILQNIQAFIYNPVQALKLSNQDGHLVIYPDFQITLRVDVPGNNMANGTQLQLHTDNGSWAQDFYFEDNSGAIKMTRYGNDSNKCLDIEGGNYWDGQKVQVYDCNGTGAQRWETWPDRTIRPTDAKWMCLDASNGLVQGSHLQIWHCDENNSRQKFLAGENDFSNYSNGRYIRMHASDTTAYWPGFTGHALISVGKRNFNNKACWSTNTFSYWPKHFNGGVDLNDTNNGGRINNMKTNADLHVDRDQDWSEAIASASNSVYRRRDLNISKRMYDEIKFMNGSYSWFKDYWNDSVQNYDAAYRNCASYTRAMWYDATGEWHSFSNPAVDEPGSLYNSIWWFNHQAGPSSQCETNTWPSS